MSRITVLGAGVCGLATAIMLARDGHEVTILERDAGVVPNSPEEAWEQWSRDGVTQFRQPHFLQPGGRLVLEAELPDVKAALESAGAVRFDALALMPPLIKDRDPRPGDDRFVTLTARRPTLEQVLDHVVCSEADIDLRRGVTVTELTTRSYDGSPHVTGVRTDAGDELVADLTVDAMGRRSQLPRWLQDAEAGPVHEETEDSGFIYYTRYFRTRDGSRPKPQAPLLMALGTFSLLTLPGDNDTWSVTVFISTGDQPLKRLRDPDRWTSLVAACPLHAHWLEGEPVTDVLPMSGVIDRYRRLSLDGRPPVTGIAQVADAWACTNPSLGRGVTFGLLHAQRLRDTVRSHLDDPRAFADQWDAVTEAELTPWYRETVDEDRERLREIEALRSGSEPPAPVESTGRLRAALLAAMVHDPDLFRAYLASRCCLTPLSETFARPEAVERISELASDGERPLTPAPNREQVLQLLSY